MSSFISRLEKPCQIVRSISQLCFAIAEGAGAAIVAEEALRGDAIQQLEPVLADQPPWSDFPLILLIAGGRVTAESERSPHFRKPLGNILLIERPARPEHCRALLKRRCGAVSSVSNSGSNPSGGRRRKHSYERKSLRSRAGLRRASHMRSITRLRASSIFFISCDLRVRSMR